MLICPKCNQSLKKKEHTWSCKNHHSYDIAKRGYVHLALNQKKNTGDDKEMVRARTRFLSHGYYEVLRNELYQIIQNYKPKRIVDAGCGEGYYTNFLKTDENEIYAFDLSKYAVDEACKARNDVQYIVASVFHLPIEDACADMVLSVFAPFDAQEFYRLLKEEGLFIKVGPGPRHLMGLKEILYDKPYENQVDPTVYDGFMLEDSIELKQVIEINDTQDIQALFHMTPYYWKTSKSAAEKLENISYLKTEVQFQIEIYRKKKTSFSNIVEL